MSPSCQCQLWRVHFHTPLRGTIRFDMVEVTRDPQLDGAACSSYTVRALVEDAYAKRAMGAGYDMPNMALLRAYFLNTGGACAKCRQMLVNLLVARYPSGEWEGDA